MISSPVAASLFSNVSAHSGLPSSSIFKIYELLVPLVDPNVPSIEFVVPTNT